MARTRKVAAALPATSAALLAIPPTTSASTTPTTHTTHFKESFDRLPLGPVTAGRGWTADTADGSLTVEPSTTGHGRELRLRTEGNGRAFMVLSDLAPRGNSFWARLRLRVNDFPTAPDWAHWTVARHPVRCPHAGTPVGRSVRSHLARQFQGSRLRSRRHRGLDRLEDLRSRHRGDMAVLRVPPRRS